MHFSQYDWRQIFYKKNGRFSIFFSEFEFPEDFVKNINIFHTEMFDFEKIWKKHEG